MTSKDKLYHCSEPVGTGKLLKGREVEVKCDADWKVGRERMRGRSCIFLLSVCIGEKLRADNETVQ